MNNPAYASVTRLPFGFARRHGVMLCPGTEGTIVCHRELPDIELLAEIQRVCGELVEYKLVSAEEFEHLLSVSYQSNHQDNINTVADIGDEIDLERLASAIPETEDLLEQENDAPVIRLINAIFAEAIRLDASDVHLEVYETRLVVRFRVDGVLRDVLEPKRVLAPLLTSRIKIMAKLDIAEKRIPQDGRISLRLAGREVDVRVSTLPSYFGERVVMRLLDKKSGRLEMRELGMSKDDLIRFDKLLHKPHGIFLVTGPTGSGKTTTLYAGIMRINDRRKNILTVEDPVEYNLAGVGQTQVNTKADMTFARGLRAILRQDPDVVMVGEIRDLETAQIAVQASLTGHLVLSTLHTNTAVGAITRLVDMGVEPFLLSSSLLGVLAQRLVRVLCDKCREPVMHDPAEMQLLGIETPSATSAYVASETGCSDCHFQGYQGRIGIYELLAIGDNLKRLIHDRASEAEITAAARLHNQGINLDGYAKVQAGITSLEEVLRVTQV